MPEPLSPQDIARRTFDVARRGYEQQEVRGFLHEVSAVVERLARAEQELRERAERAEARLEMADKPDEATLLEALGEETTRVLTSAREAANEIRTKAEESAARIIAEATAEATETRRRAVDDADSLMAETREERDGILETARTELARRTEEAEAAAARIREAAEAQAQELRDEGAADLERARGEAEAALEEARQQGRVMVAEAQAVRERILRDLAVRRKRARQQVEKLNAGRERLLSAYDVVRRTVDEATNELTVALTDARIAADAAARRIDGEPEPTLEQLDAEVSTAGLVDLPIADVDHHDEDTPGPFSGEVPAVDVEPSGSDGPVSAAADPAVPETPAVPEAGPQPAASADPVEQPRPPIVLDDRRGRKGRRRKGFEGLPPGELSVVEPPSESEGVRILAEPAVAPDAAQVAGEPSDAAPADDASTTDAPPTATDEAPGGAGPAVAAEPSADELADDEPDDAAAPSTDATIEPSAATDQQDVEGQDVEGQDVEGQDVGGPSADDAPVAPAPAGEGAQGAPTGEPPAAAESGTSAAQVFARLRAGQAAPVAEAEVAVDTETDADAAPAAPGDDDVAAPASAPADAAEPETAAADATPREFATRRDALDPIERELGRRLKRALADEQNEVLDLLRRVKPKGIADLLPSADDHAARWADAAALPLASAAQAGASAMGGEEPPAPAALASELAAALTAPLRERIDRSFTASDGNLDDVADRVRALYREWKGQRLTEAVAHYAGAAYARGIFEAVPAGSSVQWVVDPSAAPCPDCDDNVLAGAITKGEEFPTGNPCAPAHPGCHCLVLPAS